MESRAKAAGHPIHQQMVVFPLGLLATAVVFDLIGLVAGSEQFTAAAYLMIAAGVLTGLLATVFGIIDYLAIPAGTRAKRIGQLHGGGNLILLALFAVSWLLRTGTEGHEPSTFVLIVEIAALLISFATGWLGGELVGRLGVGVDDHANLDAPAKLTTGISLAKSAGHAEKL